METTTQRTNTQPTAIEKVFEFVDERVGLKTLQAKMLNEPVPGGSRWAAPGGFLPPARALRASPRSQTRATTNNARASGS